MSDNGLNVPRFRRYHEKSCRGELEGYLLIPPLSPHSLFAGKPLQKDFLAECLLLYT